MWDRLLIDCNIATMDPAIDAPFGAIEDGAIAIQDGRILRVGRRVELTVSAEDETAARGVVERLAHELFSNPLIEAYEVEVLGDPPRTGAMPA